MAEGIQGVCYKFPPGGEAMTGGQLFDSGNFNVIVQKSECFVSRTHKREVGVTLIPSK